MIVTPIGDTSLQNKTTTQYSPTQYSPNTERQHNTHRIQNDNTILTGDVVGDRVGDVVGDRVGDVDGHDCNDGNMGIMNRCHVMVRASINK